MQFLKISNKKRIYWVGCSLLILNFLCCSYLVGGIPFKDDTQFSTIQVIHAANSPPLKQKVYVDNQKMRMELEGREQQNTIIYRSDLGILYMILPQKKLCFIMPYSEALKNKDPISSNALKNLSLEGTETLEGVLCDKYEVTGPFGKAYLWINKEKEIPVRLSSQDGKNVVDWIDYQKGPQSPQLFEPPKDYQLIDMSKNIPKKSSPPPQ
ncbi:DUF4412 domain-containing protein [Methylacidiphilum caldifontis]|uniref:DUF4412 domain-containing protein n=1 Tax=Methylacidiphilum caldifontis TaxID=2795386 RepID=UPI00106DA1F3|nr:DUF4412 domain-containing protein [Methylacidiphilum caldifontis]QSR87939.1 DUF4412 domain-containing protein [Methylacidiphilum caldifontis]